MPSDEMIEKAVALCEKHNRCNPEFLRRNMAGDGGFFPSVEANELWLVIKDRVIIKPDEPKPRKPKNDLRKISAKPKKVLPKASAAPLAPKVPQKSLQQLSLDFEGTTRGMIASAVMEMQTCWVKVGKLLTDVAFGGDYKDYGYDEFESYCLSELKIKKLAVKQMMSGYNYLKAHKKDLLEALERGEKIELPQFQTVDLLYSVSTDPDICEGLKDVDAKVFSGDCDETKVRKQLRDTLKPKDIESAASARTKELSGILSSARKLKQKMTFTRAVPDGLKDRYKMLLTELESLD